MTSAATAKVSYVDLLMHEWRLDEQSGCFQARVRSVLRELCAESQLTLRREPKLEVRVSPNRGASVWAFFPCNRGRYSIRRWSMGFIPVVKPAPATKVLLELNADAFMKQPAARSKDELSHHLGHVLLYLKNPGARNECADASREWRKSVCEPVRAKKKASAKIRTEPANHRKAK
jgi:hypothetical protein